MIKSLTKNSSIATKLILQVNDFSKGVDISCGENITNMASAVQSYNFNFNSGVLTEGLGFKEFTTPTTNLSDEVQVPISYDDFTANIKSLALFRHYSRTYKEYRDKIVFYAQEMTKNVNNDDVYLASKEKYETYLKEYNSNPLVINLHEISKEVENTLLELKNILEN